VAEGGGLLNLRKAYRATPDYTRKPRFIGAFAQYLEVAVPANSPLSRIVGCQFGCQFPVRPPRSASIQMTADTYGHLFPRGDDGAELAAAERAFLGA
jgi:hypothetical protein